MRIADYMIGGVGVPRVYKNDAGAVLKVITWLPDGMDSNGRQLWRLRETDVNGVWLCDWWLRVEFDGSLTEWRDTYPRTSFLDKLWDVTTLEFVRGHEIRWAEAETGTIWPNVIKSSPSKYGSSGTFLTRCMLQPNGDLHIYNEQKFNRTDRSLWKCRPGFGQFEVTYYTDTGLSATLRSDPQPPAPAGEVVAKSEPTPAPNVPTAPSGPNVKTS